jgi:hypothetical protein
MKAFFHCITCQYIDLRGSNRDPIDNAGDSSVLELGKGGCVHFVWVADEEEKTNLTFASVHESRLCCFLRNRLTVISKKA